MAISICSGKVIWHRDHDTLVLSVWRVQGAEGVPDHPEYVYVEPQLLAEIQLGCSAKITDGGVIFEISNDPISLPVTSG